MGLVWPWFVFAGWVWGHSLHPPVAGAPPELCKGRRTGRDTAGTGNKIPILRTQELVPGAEPKVSKHPQNQPAPGLGTATAAPVTPEKSRVCTLGSLQPPWGPSSHPGVPAATLGSQQPPWSPTLEPINCPGPRDEFVQSHLREEGDEIKSCNYLLKLQPLSRRAELLQTPLAGSPWMGERE